MKDARRGSGRNGARAKALAPEECGVCEGCVGSVKLEGAC